MSEGTSSKNFSLAEYWPNCLCQCGNWRRSFGFRDITPDRTCHPWVELSRWMDHFSGSRPRRLGFCSSALAIRRTKVAALVDAAPKRDRFHGLGLPVCCAWVRGSNGGLRPGTDSRLRYVTSVLPRNADLARTSSLAAQQGKISARVKLPKMQKLSHQQSGNLGEVLALAKLNSLGVAAYASPEGAPGHDLMAVVDGTARSIEVKTRQFLERATEISRWPVDMGTKGDADFFLFVELDLRTLSPTFYLLTNEQARATHRVSKGLGNCYPSHVRKVALANDFTPLLFARAPQTPA